MGLLNTLTASLLEGATPTLGYPEYAFTYPFQTSEI